MGGENSSEATAFLKVFWVWLCVGVSQMTPLQAVQFFAAVVATVYSAVQTWAIIQDRMGKSRGCNEDRH